MDMRVKRTINSIEQSFIDLVISEGYDNLTVTQIANHAEINKKTFYDHFHSKEDLAQYLMDKFLKSYQALIQSRLINKGSFNIHIKLLLISILDNQSLKQSMKALKTIPFIEFSYQVRQLTIKELKKFNVSNDELIVRVIASIAFTTLEYYVETGEAFSIERQERMVKTLESIVSHK